MPINNFTNKTGICLRYNFWLSASVFPSTFKVLLALLISVLAASAAEWRKANSEPSGIHNLFFLGTNVISGSTPEGDAGFVVLAMLGVKTIISVDSSTPDADLARKHGLRYVHLPHGYDGINTNLQLKLAKAAESLPGPIYVHCHHGKHRGPAAAAVICMTGQGWSNKEAEAWLRAAGTSTNYAGLYRVIREYQKPSQAQLQTAPTEFPEVSQVSSIAQSMVQIDETWENLKKVRAAGYRKPSEHPDLNPANEALILKEHYRESQRQPAVRELGSDFLTALKNAEGEAEIAEGLFRGTKPAKLELDKVFRAIEQRCASCHRSYRDNK